MLGLKDTLLPVLLTVLYDVEMRATLLPVGYIVASVVDCVV